MNEKVRIIAEYLCLDFDSPDSYFIIVEASGNTPLRTYIVKLPQPYSSFLFNVYIKN